VCDGDDGGGGGGGGERSERGGAAAAWWAAGRQLPGSRGQAEAGAAAPQESAVAAPAPRAEAGPAAAGAAEPGAVARMHLAQQRHQHRWSHLLALLVGSPSAAQLVWNSSAAGAAGALNSSGAGGGRGLWRGWGASITSLFGKGGSPISRDRRAAAMVSLYDGISM